MREVLEFLNNLQKNNNRLWFEAHRDEYINVNNKFRSFTQSLITGISEFDSRIKNLSVNDCTYRIYRDIRFSKDKTPYKTHMGAFVSFKGKQSGYSGYYFHIEARDSDYIGGHLLCTGIYRPEPKVIKSIREEIMLNGKNFIEAVQASKGSFELDGSEKLKKVPAGFPSDSEYAELFKHKQYLLSQYVDDEFILSENLLEKTLKEFKKTLPFNNLLNRAAAYAYGVDF